MKTSILLISTTIAIISLPAFSYLTKSETPTTCSRAPKEIIKEPKFPFFYDYGTRFGGITKETIRNAKFVTDFFPKEHAERIVSYDKVKLVIINDQGQSDERIYSKGKTLTEAQRKLLLSLNYSTSFNLRADCTHRNPETGEIESSFYSPHLTIVPEKQAVYLDGKEALLDYLIKGSKKEKKIAHQQEKLRPAKLFFIVTKNGSITNVRIGNHSGYEPIDKKLIKLVKELPGKWQAAENDKGEKIDQEFTISYGLEGC